MLLALIWYDVNNLNQLDGGERERGTFLSSEVPLQEFPRHVS